MLDQLKNLYESAIDAAAKTGKALAVAGLVASSCGDVMAKRSKMKYRKVAGVVCQVPVTPSQEGHEECVVKCGQDWVKKHESNLRTLGEVRVLLRGCVHGCDEMQPITAPSRRVESVPAEAKDKKRPKRKVLKKKVATVVNEPSNEISDADAMKAFREPFERMCARVGVDCSDVKLDR